MSPRLTSLVVPVWRALADTITDVAGGVPVSFGPPIEGAAFEQYVVVSSLVGQAAEQSQWTFGPGTRRQGFRCAVQVLTSGHPTMWLAADRLHDMQTLIEETIRRASVAPSNRHHRPDIKGVDWWEIVSTSEQVWPDPEAGCAARSVVVIEVTTSI
jgi:hypothetical protein